MARYIKAVVLSVDAIVKPIVSCACGAVALASATRVRLDCTDFKHGIDPSIFDTNLNNVDIPVGWGQNGRGSYSCPSCNGYTKEYG